MSARPPLTSTPTYKLLLVAELIARPFSQVVGHVHQITLVEWRVMICVHDSPMSVATEVVERTGMEKMAVNRAVSRMANRGLLTRHDDPDDARRVRLKLTKAGERLFREIERGARARAARLMRDLDAARIRELEATLDILIEAARDLPTR